MFRSPVLKWLGYLAGRLPRRRPLTPDERSWFRSMVQRIAAILAIDPQLDDLYSAASEDAFAAAELGNER
jgi:hypothetical protein